jgi:hypothetical protein
MATVIAGATSAAHVQSNASAVGWVLADADMAEIDRITLQKGRTRASLDGRRIASRTVTLAFDPRPSYWEWRRSERRSPSRHLAGEEERGDE